MSKFWESFNLVEADLWKQAYRTHREYSRGAYDGWVLCPRSHAVKHLRCIIELTSKAYPGLPGLLWLAKKQFDEIGRYLPGDDLVFAIGDVQ